MDDIDWPKMLEDLQSWLDYSKENEPSATNFHASLEDVIASLPEAAFA
jgi:hypothetical protein